MAARDYKLGVSAVTGTVYITKVSKQNPGMMTDDRVVVTDSNFITCLLDWAESQLKGDEDRVSITHEGRVIAEIILQNRNAENTKQ